jgi:hypothetical protein
MLNSGKGMFFLFFFGCLSAYHSFWKKKKIVGNCSILGKGSFFWFLAVNLPITLSACLYVHLYVCLLGFLFFHIFLCLSVDFLFYHLSNFFLCILASIVSICLSICISVSLSLSLSVSTFIYIFFKDLSPSK